VFRAVILSDGHTLQQQDFPQISGMEPIISAQEAAGLQEAAGNGSDAHNEGSDNKLKFLDRSGHLRSLEDIERELIQFAIENYSGHMSEVARRLGIGRSTLYRKVREHELDTNIKQTAQK